MGAGCSSGSGGPETRAEPFLAPPTLTLGKIEEGKAKIADNKSIQDMLSEMNLTLTFSLRQFRPEECHIVVVDDDVATLTSCVKWLQDVGYLVSTCGSGQELVNLLKLASEGSSSAEGKVTDINALLVDVTMQTDAGSVLDTVRSHPSYCQIPLILIGLDVTPQEAERLMRRGSADFLHKPMSSSLLQRSMRLLLEGLVEQHNSLLLKQEGDKYKSLAKEGQHRKEELSKFSSSLVVSVTKPGGGTSFMEAPGHVLVVDSSAQIQDQLKGWLRRADYQVSVCDSAEDAIRLLGSVPADVEIPYSVILSSLEFANEGMTGDQLVKIVGEYPRLKQTPVILMTEEDGNSPRETSQLLRSGADTCVRKPLARELVLKKISQLLVRKKEYRKCAVYVERAEKYKRLFSMLEKLPAEKASGDFKKTGVHDPPEEHPAHASNRRPESPSVSEVYRSHSVSQHPVVPT